MRNINIFVCFTHKKQNKQKSHSQKPFPGVSDQIGLKGLMLVIKIYLLLQVSYLMFNSIL
jgi:hypothetical protein